jgi:hypothetical protein
MRFTGYFCAEVELASRAIPSFEHDFLASHGLGTSYGISLPPSDPSFGVPRDEGEGMGQTNRILHCIYHPFIKYNSAVL